MEGFTGFRRKRRHTDDSDEEEEDNTRISLGFGTSFQPAKQTSQPQTPKNDKPIKSRSATPAPDPGFAEFNKHSKGVALKMLEKMGWKMGQGLGASGEGIVNPIEVKQRPKGMGLQFRGFDERTDQTKVEAKLKNGEPLSEEEELKPKREAWKSQKKRKPKAVYKTAAEVVAEIQQQQQPLTSQKVLDMTGPGIREISLADIKRSDSPTLMETTTRLPELRHNLRLIVDLARSDLENLSREKQTTSFKMTALKNELDAIGKSMDSDRERFRKLEKIKEIASDLERISKDALATGAYEAASITALFGEKFDILEKEFSLEIKEMNLDALVVSVWAPILKYRTVHWNVLDDPSWGINDFKRWKRLLPSNDDDESEWSWTRNGRVPKQKLVCTPFETMMNTVWLSKVRSTINNQWDIHDPEPLVQLMSEWEPVLPRFIFENIIQQLILPKIVQAVQDWNPRTDEVMIHTWIHPWLPILKAWRLADLFTTIRQKMAIVLRQWHPSDESALHIILPWKDIWTSEQTEQFVLRSILPKLTNTLRDEFEVNPRNQELDSLIWCLAWKDMLSQTVLGQLLENEFFNKWLHVLFQWLSLDITQVNYDEIRTWYLWWRQLFDSYGLNTNKHVMKGFKDGLDLMNRALNDELGT
ncbi:TFP11-domain-containing protein [Rhizopus microsporus]|uniref:TFP11-domain-containing protein n=1 Tax=Rhizopus microsporus TaxID=58291 RepID=A0A1X0RSV4_RHIZD|nr:TFP11-domain-containing protein [Rhizopus microsporus]